MIRSSIRHAAEPPSSRLATDQNHAHDDVHMHSTTITTASLLIDEKQLCADLGISSVTATKWRANASGPPFIKVGRLVRYRRADVEAWLVSRTVGRAPT